MFVVFKVGFFVLVIDIKEIVFFSDFWGFSGVTSGVFSLFCISVRFFSIVVFLFEGLFFIYFGEGEIRRVGFVFFYVFFRSFWDGLGL